MIIFEEKTQLSKNLKLYRKNPVFFASKIRKVISSVWKNVKEWPSLWWHSTNVLYKTPTTLPVMGSFRRRKKILTTGLNIFSPKLFFFRRKMKTCHHILLKALMPQEFSKKLGAQFLETTPNTLISKRFSQEHFFKKFELYTKSSVQYIGVPEIVFGKE